MVSLDNHGGKLFRELKAAALEKWSRREAAATVGRLVEASSRAADRIGIVEAVATVLPEFEVQEYYNGKDEARARELLEREESTTEALALAPPSSKLFGSILERRIRRYYSAGEMARCSRDCCYMVEHQPQDQEDQQRAKIKALLIHVSCSKATGEPELSRRLLNEAMRRINELAAKESDPAAAKARVLQSCLLTDDPTTSRPCVGRTARALAHPPRLYGKQHDVLSCCSDALALSRDAARGRFLYATRNIKPGSVLIVDRPFSFSTDISALGTNCANCHLSFRLDNVTQIPCKTCSTIRYCSEECRRLAWDKFHQYECRIFNYFFEKDLQQCNALLAYRTVVGAFLRVERDRVIVNADTVRLHADVQRSNDIVAKTNANKYEHDDYETVFNLETHCADQELQSTLENAIHSIFLARCLIYSLRRLDLELDCSKKLESTLAVGFLHSIQAIKCNAYEIVENVRNEETKILEPRNVGGAIYTSVSLSNHSCYPNIVRHCFPNGVVVVTSLRFIPKGAEILDCYGQHFLEHHRDHRRRHLKMKYYFECKCEACLFDWPRNLQNNDHRFKCKRCLKQCRKIGHAIECTECGEKTAIHKSYNLLQSSIEKRITALARMYDGCYSDALPLLLQHANYIEKVLLEPSLETIKTQQSIIQCLNAMSSVSI